MRVATAGSAVVEASACVASEASVFGSVAAAPRSGSTSQA
jgi:hypothetical protein